MKQEYHPQLGWVYIQHKGNPRDGYQVVIWNFQKKVIKYGSGSSRSSAREDAGLPVEGD